MRLPRGYIIQCRILIDSPDSLRSSGAKHIQTPPASNPDIDTWSHTAAVSMDTTRIGDGTQVTPHASEMGCDNTAYIGDAYICLTPCDFREHVGPSRTSYNPRSFGDATGVSDIGKASDFRTFFYGNEKNMGFVLRVCKKSSTFAQKLNYRLKDDSILCILLFLLLFHRKLKRESMCVKFISHNT